MSKKTFCLFNPIQLKERRFLGLLFFFVVLEWRKTYKIRLSHFCFWKYQTEEIPSSLITQRKKTTATKKLQVDIGGGFCLAFFDIKDNLFINSDHKTIQSVSRLKEWI